MEKIRYVYYQDGELWVGWLEMYPDYKSQGNSIEKLEENLKDIYAELSGGKIPQVRKIGELAVK
jgi:predicted RNase H-like HicB family nuclease